jgi:hypothetical protein
MADEAVLNNVNKRKKSKKSQFKTNFKIKNETNIDRQCPILNNDNCHLADPHLFSLHTTFKVIVCVSENGRQ